MNKKVIIGITIVGGIIGGAVLLAKKLATDAKDDIFDKLLQRWDDNKNNEDYCIT